jgi:hypothetical protein
MLHMSRHKFASNVCEKALLTADLESRRALIQEMMTSKQDGVSTIATMMKDQYASEQFNRPLAAYLLTCYLEIMFCNVRFLLQTRSRSTS